MLQFCRIKTAVLGGCLAAAAVAMGTSAHAQPYPVKPITLMVPYPAGGASDVVARAVATSMAKELRQPVIVENLGGASGVIAARKVLNAPGDGYYVYVGSANELILAPLSIGTAKFVSEDFRLVQRIGDLTLAVLSRGDLPATNMQELVQYASQRAKAGKPLTFGSVGVGTLYHVLGEKFSQSVGVPMLHVPYKGGTPLTLDLVGGQIDLYLGALGTTSPGFVRSGKLRMLAIISPERAEEYKSVPATTDSAALKDFSFGLWIGMFVKKDTPEAVVNALHKAMTSALHDPGLKASADNAKILMAKPQSLSQAESDYARSIAQYRSIANSIALQR